MIAQNFSLSDFVDRIYLPERTLKWDSARQLRLSVRALEQYAKRTIRLADLSEELLSQWILAMELRWAPRTLKRRRADLLAIWRYAAETGHLGRDPIQRRVRRVKVPKSIPEAWTHDDLRRLIEATRQLDSYFPWGTHRGRQWEAMIRVAYDSGLRPCDLWRLERKQIEPDGTIRLVQEKTGFGHLCQLRPETIAAIDATYPPEREAVFPWGYSRMQKYYHWRHLLRAAGMPITAANGIRKIRKSSGSYAELENPGTGGKHLGHQTPGMFDAHYNDPRITGGVRKPPPAFD